jgi:hypothetical protein
MAAPSALPHDVKAAWRSGAPPSILREGAAEGRWYVYFRHRARCVPHRRVIADTWHRRRGRGPPEAEHRRRDADSRPRWRACSHPASPEESASDGQPALAQSLTIFLLLSSVTGFFGMKRLAGDRNGWLVTEGWASAACWPPASCPCASSSQGLEVAAPRRTGVGRVRRAAWSGFARWGREAGRARREERDEDDDAGEQDRERGGVCAQRACARWSDPLAGRCAGDCERLLGGRSPARSWQASGAARRGWQARRLISRSPIFLPRYSGIRPTISPARKTASTTISSIP